MCEPSRDPDHDSHILRARERVELLASESGEFVVACRESGVSPPSVSDARLDSYAGAERAREAAASYRTAIPELDPGLERYDLVVCGVKDTHAGLASVRETTSNRRDNGLPRTSRSVTLSGDGRDEWIRGENVPVVHLAGPDAPLDDEVVERQLLVALRDR